MDTLVDEAAQADIAVWAFDAPLGMCIAAVSLAQCSRQAFRSDVYDVAMRRSVSTVSNWKR